jgi:kynurenine/2-aminoadipate aminotransferase
LYFFSDRDNSTIQLDTSAMSKALQYLPTPGYVFVLNMFIHYFLHQFRQLNLLEWFKKLQNHYHTPIEFKRYDLCITNGSMEGLSKVFELVLNPTDPILVDSPCYSGSLDFVCSEKFKKRK